MNLISPEENDIFFCQFPRDREGKPVPSPLFTYVFDVAKLQLPSAPSSRGKDEDSWKFQHLHFPTPALEANISSVGDSELPVNSSTAFPLENKDLWSLAGSCRFSMGIRLSG